MTKSSAHQYQRDLAGQIPPVHVDDLTRARAALNLVRLGVEREIADMLGVEEFYRATERYGS
jgi:hypothetical protein